MTNITKWLTANISQPEKVINFWEGIKKLPEEYKEYYVQYAAYSFGLPENAIEGIGFWIIGIANTDEKKESLVYIIADEKCFEYKGQATRIIEAYDVGCFVMERTKLNDLHTHEYHTNCKIKRKELTSKLLVSWCQDNAQPISGIILRVDKTSKVVSYNGSNYPLYLPKVIAEETLVAINTCIGLPLYVDNLLLGNHPKRQIVGVIIAAEIIEQDFIIRGHLFSWNPHMIDAFVNGDESLGMSVNAYVSGKITQINSVDVFCASNLYIIGATIKYWVDDRPTEIPTWWLTSTNKQSDLNYFDNPPFNGNVAVGYRLLAPS
jgi:hypothetical protein